MNLEQNYLEQQLKKKLINHCKFVIKINDLEYLKNKKKQKIQKRHLLNIQQNAYNWL